MIPVCHNLRRYANNVFKGIATDGKGTMGWCHGFKLHLACNDRMMLRKRYIIETINDMLKNTAQIVHSRHRSVSNFIMNLISALGAYCFFDNKPKALVASAYWEIGKMLHERKVESGHGDDEKVLRAVALLPWSHNLLIMSKNKNDEATLFYAQETIEKGWNRDLLLNAIKLNMYESQLATNVDNNFSRTLPMEQAQYANEVFSSSYNLGFLGVTSPILELELEDRLVKAITRFLMELGNGFTFIGNQHVLEYNGKESKVDMLFFHRGLRCLVAVDLKIGAFKPEYAGKMNYYLSLLDRLERGEDENRSIGIILCAEKDRVEVELALEDMGKPIGVADYQLIVPKKELEEVLTNEIKKFGEEKKYRKRNKINICQK